MRLNFEQYFDFFFVSCLAAYIPVVRGESYVREGSQLNLSCIFPRASSTTLYRWLKNGSIIAVGYRFIIKDVKRTNAGVYVCEATIGRSHFSSGTLQVVVQSKYFIQ